MIQYIAFETQRAAALHSDRFGLERDRVQTLQLKRDLGAMQVNLIIILKLV